MAKKQPPIPPELATFIKKGETTFHCDDGDWDLNIDSRDDSDFKDELPPRSTSIAENGSGDCLFLKTNAAGKIDAKVYVYWHEEERTDTFAKSIKELIETSDKIQKETAKKSKTPPTAKTKVSLKKVEEAIFSRDTGKQMQARRDFRDSDFGLDSLPMLRRALASDDVSTVIFAAECITRLGPEAATCPAGEAERPIIDGQDDEGDLFQQLTLRGAQVWSYSGYSNCYSDCLHALVTLKYEPEYLVDFVRTHIGLSPDALIHSLKALQSVGTPEARELAQRAVDFWLPDLNMSQAKKANAVLASFGTMKSASAKKKK